MNEFLLFLSYQLLYRFIKSQKAIKVRLFIATVYETIFIIREYPYTVTDAIKDQLNSNKQLSNLSYTSTYSINNSVDMSVKCQDV